MKILFLSQLPPPIHGASIINKSIMESTLIHSTFEAKFVNISPAKHISDIGKPSAGKILKSIYILKNVLSAYIRLRPEWIYLTISPTGIALFKDAALVLIPRIFGAKLIFHLHGKGIENYSQKNFFTKLLFNNVFSNVRVIHLAETLTRDISHLVPASRIHIVNNGIKLTPLLREKHVPHGTPVKFLYLSNLIREKGGLELLDACLHLQNEGFTFELVIGGKFLDSRFENEFREKLSKLDIRHIKLFDKGVYGTEKQTALHESHVMVLPTYYANECYPLTLIEAMSARMAIISTNEGAIADMVVPGSNGFLIEKRNSAAVAEAMRYFIEKPTEVFRMGQHCYERYCENNTFEIFEDRLVNVLREITSLN
jgi:glycosyltransferase involved in cell wall biosynthesis